jgi:outer membrane protein TolC
VSQAIPFPGKLALRGKIALAEAESAQSDVESERVQLAELASRLFDEYWLADRALEINAQHAALLDDTHAVALSRYAVGSGTQQDVLAAETEQGMLAHQERELATQRKITIERINTLLHRAPELPLPAPPRELERDASFDDLDAQALFARALETRPELRARTAMVRAREEEVALARREFLPDFTVRGGYQTSWQESPLQPVVGVELNVPLQLGRRVAALEEADARLSREQSRARALEDRVRFEVISAVERLRESQHLLEISQQRRLPPARDRVVGARAAFASGRISFLEFIDAERSLLAAEQAEFEVRADVSVRRAALSRALGEVPGAEGGAP